MKVFIAGPRAVKNLNSKLTERLEKIRANNITVLVGDAVGIDREIQSYFHSHRYDNVKVFAANGKVRNNIGQWDVEKVMVKSGVKGFNFYAAKDLAMAKESDYGFMIWNGKSRGTFNNIINLVNFNKKILVYLTFKKQFYTISSMEDVDDLKERILQVEKKESYPTDDPDKKQLSLFM